MTTRRTRGSVARGRDQDVDPRLPMTSSPGCAMRLTVAQALVRFLSVQSVERDGHEQRFFAGCFGIFGHGNVAGLGQALLESGDDLALLPRSQRAGHGAHRRGLRAHVEPAARLRVHVLHRTGRHQHGHRCGGGHDEPDTGAAAARRRVRHAPGQPGAPRTRGPDVAGRLGQRLPAAGIALLRPRLAPRATAPGAACSDARAHRPRRDRRGHPGPAPGRPDRGVRRPRRPLRAAGLADPPPAARASDHRRAGRAGARVPAAPDRRRRRRHLPRGHERARRPGRRDGHPCRRDPGGQGLAALRPPRQPRCARGDRNDGRQRRRARRRRGDRSGDAVERLHHRVALGVRQPRCPGRQHQRGAL